MKGFMSRLFGKKSRKEGDRAGAARDMNTASHSKSDVATPQKLPGGEN